jgi:UDP-N-acetylglucosamine--N-acetylmuramyl-(pentapeptide) pyrophosphoryl-undecaprenol N-acetylglucosamine transferase
MVLIPLCGSGTRGDQVENAEFFRKKGAALVFAGEEANPENLSRIINELAQDTERREIMAKSAHRIGSLDGAVIIGDSIIKLINRIV